MAERIPAGRTSRALVQFRPRPNRALSRHPSTSPTPLPSDEKTASFRTPVTGTRPLGASAANAAATKGGHTGLSKAKVTMLLELQHPGGLNRFVRRVSDPTDPLYRHYSTVEQLVAKLRRQAEGDRAGHRLVRPARCPRHALVDPHLRHRELSREGAPTSSCRPRRAPPTASGTGGSWPADRPGGARRRRHAVSVGPEDGVDEDRGRDRPGAWRRSRRWVPRKKVKYGSILFHTGTAAGCPAGSEPAEVAPLEPFTPNQYLTAYGDTTMHAPGAERRRPIGRRRRAGRLQALRHRNVRQVLRGQQDPADLGLEVSPTTNRRPRKTRPRSTSSSSR